MHVNGTAPMATNSAYEVWYWYNFINVYIVRVPVLLLSSIGNLLIILVMRLPSNRKSSTSVLFTGLAVADFWVAIWSFLPRLIWNAVNLPNMYALPGIDIYLNVRVIFFTTVKFCSNWLLVTITVERMLCVFLPFRVKEIFTRKNAVVIVISAFALSTVISCVRLLVLVRLYVDIKYLVYMVAERFPNGATIQLLFAIFVEFFIPFCIILVGSIIILYKLNIRTIVQSDMQSARAKTITRNLLAANILFLLCHLPYLLLTFAESRFFFGVNFRIYLEWQIVERIATDLFRYGSVFNFYVYCISGKCFRDDVKSLFRSCFVFVRSKVRKTPVKMNGTKVGGDLET